MGEREKKSPKQSAKATMADNSQKVADNMWQPASYWIDRFEKLDEFRWLEFDEFTRWKSALVADAVAKVEAIDEPGYLPSEEQAVDERSGEFYALLDDYFQQPEQRLRLTALNYASRTGDVTWGYGQKLMPTDEGLDTDWAEYERQASLIAHRISELADDEDDRDDKAKRETRRETAFLKYYAREALLPVYAAGYSVSPGIPSLGPGIPDDLVYILRCEYPGDDKLMGYLQLEIKKPMTKLVAQGVVLALPLVSESQLARVFNIEKGTIRNWAPDLKAAGWKGPQEQIYSRKATTAKSKRGEPWRPGDPPPQFSKDD